MIGESGANGYFRCTTTVAAWPGRPDSGIELASTFFHETIEKWRRGISMDSTPCICQDIYNQPLTVRTCRQYRLVDACQTRLACWQQPFTGKCIFCTSGSVHADRR